MKEEEEKKRKKNTTRFTLQNLGELFVGVTEAQQFPLQRVKQALIFLDFCEFRNSQHL